MDHSVREIVKRSPARTVRMLYLTHLQEQPIECESTLERDFVLVAALFPGTLFIQHQPFRLELANERHYTPDFLVHFKDGSRAVVEVKPKVHIHKHAERLLEADERMRPSGQAPRLTC